MLFMMFWMVEKILKIFSLKKLWKCKYWEMTVYKYGLFISLIVHMIKQFTKEFHFILLCSLIKLMMDSPFKSISYLGTLCIGPNMWCCRDNWAHSGCFWKYKQLLYFLQDQERSFLNVLISFVLVQALTLCLLKTFTNSLDPDLDPNSVWQSDDSIFQLELFFHEKTDVSPLLMSKAWVIEYNFKQKH